MFEIIIIKKSYDFLKIWVKNTQNFGAKSDLNQKYMEWVKWYINRKPMPSWVYKYFFQKIRVNFDHITGFGVLGLFGFWTLTTQDSSGLPTYYTFFWHSVDAL